MSDSTRATSAGYGQIKTLAVRLSEDVRAQLDIIAQLNDRTVTDEIRLAIEAWIEKTKSDPSVLQRAQHVRDEIEREAATKRGAIEAIFSNPTVKPKASPSTRSGAEKDGSS
jgi:predicted DNA-binding protein